MSMLTSVLESHKAWNGEIEGNLKISKRLRNLKQDVKKCVGWIYSSRGAEWFAAKATKRSETRTDEPTSSTNCVWISMKVHRTDWVHFNMCTDKKTTKKKHYWVAICLKFKGCLKWQKWNTNSSTESKRLSGTRLLSYFIFKNFVTLSCLHRLHTTDDQFVAFSAFSLSDMIHSSAERTTTTSTLQ